MSNEFAIVGIDTHGKRFIYSLGSERQCIYGAERYEKIFDTKPEIMRVVEARKSLKSKKKNPYVKNFSPLTQEC